MNSNRTPLSFVYFALVLVQILFGIHYAVSKTILENFPPLIWASLRMTLASLLIFLIAFFYRRKNHPPFEAKFFLPVAFYAFFGTTLSQGAFLMGLHYTTATNSAVLNTLLPVFTLLIATFLGQEAFHSKKLIGFGLALLGALCVRRFEDFRISDQTFLGDALVVFSCISNSIFLVSSKKFMAKYDTVWITTWFFILGSIGLILFSLPSWAHFAWPHFSGALIGSICYSVIGCTVITYFLNNWALARTQSSLVALFCYIQPIVSSFFVWIWLDEKITLQVMIACLCIFSGLLIALSKKVRYEIAL
jgi:drug/metabolite transporter (DMT)-like permease